MLVCLYAGFSLQRGGAPHSSKSAPRLDTVDNRTPKSYSYGMTKNSIQLKHNTKRENSHKQGSHKITQDDSLIPDAQVLIAVPDALP